MSKIFVINKRVDAILQNKFFNYISVIFRNSVMYFPLKNHNFSAPEEVSILYNPTPLRDGVDNFYAPQKVTDFVKKTCFNALIYS